MAILGTYKPKYQDSITDVMNSSPAAKIAGIATLGVAPAIAAGVGKALNTGRAMFSDTGDPMALVKGKTGQVAGELSDFTTGKAGKPTVTQPTPIATRKIATAAPPANSGTTFGNVGLPTMGPKDLSKMSNGTLPIARRAPVRSAGTAQVITQPDEEGLRKPEIAAIDTRTAGERIFTMPAGEDSAGLASASIQGNGGFATQGGKTFVLPKRYAGEEDAFKTELAQQRSAQPITAIASQSAPRTSTIGYGHGVYELAQGQNAPPDFSNMSIGEMAVAKFGLNQQKKITDIANVNSGIALAGNKDNREAAKFPFDIAASIADVNYKSSSADHLRNTDTINREKLPFDINNTKALTDSHVASAENSRSQTRERDFLAPAQATKLLVEAAESQQRVKAALAPAAAKGSLTQKDIVDGAHTDAYKTAVDMIKSSETIDPVERQKEFERYYHDARLKFLSTYKQMQAGV